MNEMKCLIVFLVLILLAGCSTEITEVDCPAAIEQEVSITNEEVITMYEYKADIIRVIDGDTVVMNIDLGFGIRFQETVRLAGINTPEIFGVKKDSDEYKKGIEAKTLVENLLRDSSIMIQTEKDKKGKYGRYIATIIIKGIDGDINLNERLVTENLAEKVDY